MSKLSYKISLPVILAGLFAVSIFIALNYQNAEPSFYLVLFMLTFFTFFFGFATGQNLSSPIKQLLEKANDLSQGNNTGKLYLETKDELADLARALNQIAEELEAKEGETHQAEQFVDLKVRARTRDLEDTINSLDQKVKNRTIELERLMSEANKLKTQVKESEGEIAKLKQVGMARHSKSARPKPSQNFNPEQ